jgi:hypothetical protein
MRLLAAACLVSLLGVVPAQAQAEDDNSCAGVIERWQAFATQESQGGHMDTPVFEKIQAEISRASDQCQAGQDASARKTIEQSKRRHGY